jgi:hypothetical protein
LQGLAKACKELQKVARVCKWLQGPAKAYKDLQRTSRTYSWLQRAAKHLQDHFYNRKNHEENWGYSSLLPTT